MVISDGGRLWLLRVVATAVLVGAFFVFPWPVALWADGVLFLASAAIGEILTEIRTR